MSKTIKYPGIVRAAQNLTESKKKLAEVLEATDPTRAQEIETEVERETGERLEELQ
jgi:hypothetical protein